jgi:hypothetical protein
LFKSFLYSDYKVLELKKQHQAKLKTKTTDNLKVTSDVPCDDYNINEFEDFKSKEVESSLNLEYESEPNNLIPVSIAACEEFGGK